MRYHLWAERFDKIDLTHRRARRTVLRALRWLSVLEKVGSAKRHRKQVLRWLSPGRTGQTILFALNRKGKDFYAVWSVIPERLDYIRQRLEETFEDYQARRWTDEHWQEARQRFETTPEWKKRQRLHQEVVHQCPHCGKKGKGSVMARHHFDKCKTIYSKNPDQKFPYKVLEKVEPCYLPRLVKR